MKNPPCKNIAVIKGSNVETRLKLTNEGTSEYLSVILS